MLVGDDSVPVDPAGSGPAGQGVGVGHHVNHDLGTRRRTSRIDRCCGAVGLSARTGERCSGEQCVHGVGLAFPEGAAIPVADGCGQLTYRGVGSSDVLGGHDRGDLTGAVTVVLGPHPAFVERFAAPFPDGVGVVTEDQAVDHVAQTGRRPRPGPGAQQVGDRFVEHLDDPAAGGVVGVEKVIIGHQVRAADDLADLVRPDDAVAQRLQHPRQPITKTQCLVDQHPRPVAGDPGLARDPGDDVTETVGDVTVADGGQQPITQHQDRLVAAPRQIRLARADRPQTLHMGGGVGFGRAGRIDPGEELARQIRPCPHSDSPEVVAARPG